MNIETVIQNHQNAAYKLIGIDPVSVQILENVKEGIIVYDKTGHYLMWNVFMEGLFGIFASEVTGKSPSDILPLEFLPIVEENLHKALKGVCVDGFVYNFRIPLKGKSGWVMESTRPLKNETGEIIGAFSTLRDITKSKKASEALIDAESVYHDLYNHTPTMFLSVEVATGKVIECNETLLKKTGFDRSEVIGNSIFNRYHPDSVANAKLNLEIFKSTGEVKNSEMYLLTKIGGKMPVLLNSTAVRDETGKILYSRSVLQDISVLKQVEEELIQSEERFRAVADTAIDSIITIDEIGIVVGWNQGAKKSFGYEESEIIGKPVSLLISDGFKNGDIEEFKSLNIGKSGFMVGKTIELNAKRKSGEIFPVEISLASWRTERDQFYTGIVRDITKRKSAEHELKRSQEQMKKFAAHLQNVREEERILLAREIHDELGQILSAIKIDLGLLIHCMSKEKGIGSCDKIMNPINDIYKLVDKTILTARKIMSELRPEVLDTIGFIEAVRSYIIDYQNRYKIECDFNTSVSELKLTSQQSIALYRICQEALSNVAKHAEASLVNIDLDIKGANLIMVISDNGKGMSVRQKTRMDSYGLIGMRERVFLLEGEMIIISEPGKGTSIKISVPYLLNVALNK